jgi:putative peptidoglycan lipid II flippase
MSTTTPPRAVPDEPPGLPAPTTLERLRAMIPDVLPRGAIVISILTFAGYAMGLVRDRMFARTFGAGPDLDAYNAAFVLPELALDVLVASAIVAPFVPLFTGLRDSAAEDARAFGRTILTYSVVVMAVASAVLFVLAPESIGLIAPGFRDEQRDLYVNLFRLMLVTPVIFAASIVLGEILVAERRFFWFAIAPLFYNGGIVLGVLLLADRLGIYAAAIGAVIGALAHLGARLAGISQTTFRPRPRFVLRTKGLGEFVRLMIPKMISHPIEPLTFLFFTALASTLEPGSVSSVSFARNFASVPVSLIGASFAIAALPSLSAQFARGDRGGFTRTFGSTLGSVAVITTAGAVALFLVGELAIRVLLGGGAFDEAAVARTSSILVVFAIAVPLESLTHVLSRGLYATHNTLLQSLASVVGFVVTVAVALALAPTAGLASIPASFAAGMAVKVVLLALALAPRISRIGGPPGRDAKGANLPFPARVLGRTLAAGALVVLVVGTLVAAGQALSVGASLTVAPEVTPWARVNPPASPRAALPPIAPGSPPSATSDPGSGATPDPPSGSDPSPGPDTSPAPAAGASPGPPPPFSMNLYEDGDFIRQLENTWCVAAAVQTSMNIMDEGADLTRKTQARLDALVISLSEARDGGALPNGWARALTDLGYGAYEVRAHDTLRGAIQAAARQIRLTNRPVGLLVWRGAHSWVMSGFTATADPGATDAYRVTRVRIQDVWYNRFSTLWGWSRPPDANVPVAALAEDFKRWDTRIAYPEWDGKFVIVVPVE